LGAAGGFGVGGAWPVAWGLARELTGLIMITYTSSGFSAAQARALRKNLGKNATSLAG